MQETCACLRRNMLPRGARTGACSGCEHEQNPSRAASLPHSAVWQQDCHSSTTCAAQCRDHEVSALRKRCLMVLLGGHQHPWCAETGAMNEERLVQQPLQARVAHPLYNAPQATLQECLCFQPASVSP